MADPVILLGAEVLQLKAAMIKVINERDEALTKCNLKDVEIRVLTEKYVQTRDALESMCHQYLSVYKGKIHHDFMSAGESAFEALGWDDGGQPLPPDMLCETEGCGEAPVCGIPTPDGHYHRWCNQCYGKFRFGQ